MISSLSYKKAFSTLFKLISIENIGKDAFYKNFNKDKKFIGKMHRSQGLYADQKLFKIQSSIKMHRSRVPYAS
jgi:hypothetical protein